MSASLPRRRLGLSHFDSPCLDHAQRIIGIHFNSLPVAFFSAHIEPNPGHEIAKSYSRNSVHGGTVEGG